MFTNVKQCRNENQIVPQHVERIQGSLLSNGFVLIKFAFIIRTIELKSYYTYYANKKFIPLTLTFNAPST